MEHPKTNTISNAFSRQIDQYHLSSAFHQKLAHQLAQSIQQYCQSPKTVFEIGSHTGLLTQAIKGQIKPDTLWITSDLHRASTCHSPQEAHHFIADGEYCPIQEHSMDLIYSGASFQWFKQFDDSVERLMKCLKPGGVLAFSIFTNPSLEPFRRIVSSVDSKKRFIDLFSLADLQKKLTPYHILDLQTSQETEFFSSFSDLRRFLKNMGATASVSSEKSISRKQYQSIVARYEKEKQENGLPLQLSAALVLLKNKDLST